MRNHIHTEITIAAEPATVWEAITDLNAYPAWNPYHRRVETTGDLVPGQRLVVHIRKPNDAQVVIKPHVIRIEPNRELTWGGGLKGIFHGEHRFVLEPVAGGTRLVHSETFAGLAVRFASLDSIEEGYELMNEALRRYVEQSATGPGADPSGETVGAA
jgi:hypothetical protein